ncbi:MAG: hypothetical protein M3Q10_18250, partial [Chloroflexota bacterium]|nr:hypothetical protein [Chloroflexota bacterium]
AVERRTNAIGPGRVRGAGRALTAAVGGLWGALALGDAAAKKDPGGNGDKTKDRDRQVDDRPNGDRDRDPAWDDKNGKDDRGDEVERIETAQKGGDGGTKVERRAERGEQREQADQSASEQSAGDQIADDGSGLADRLRERAEEFRARQGADATVDAEDDADGPVDIEVDLERDAQDAVSVDLNIPDLSDLLADLPEGAGVDDDIVFAQAGDSISLVGDPGTFAIANPDDGDDAGGDNDVDFSS